MSQQPTPTIEDEIDFIINKILQKTVVIDTGDFSQSIKDESKKILAESIKMITDELDPIKIDKLVYNEWKKGKSVS